MATIAHRLVGITWFSFPMTAAHSNTASHDQEHVHCPLSAVGARSRMTTACRMATSGSIGGRGENLRSMYNCCQVAGMRSVTEPGVQAQQCAASRRDVCNDYLPMLSVSLTSDERKSAQQGVCNCSVSQQQVDDLGSSNFRPKAAVGGRQQGHQLRTSLHKSIPDESKGCLCAASQCTGRIPMGQGTCSFVLSNLQATSVSPQRPAAPGASLVAAAAWRRGTAGTAATATLQCKGCACGPAQSTRATCRSGDRHHAYVRRPQTLDIAHPGTSLDAPSRGSSALQHTPTR